ncbi:MAG: PAS domain-containing protein, partial [Desulfonatronovibrio sp.]
MLRPSQKNQPNQNIFPDSQGILDNAPIGIFTTTPDGRYLYVNNTLAQMHGYDSPKQLM